MTGINDRIDRHVKQQNRKTIVTVIATLVTTIPLILIFLSPNLGSISQTQGVVVRLIGLPTDEGQNLYLLVKLKSGDNVRVYIPSSSFFEKGRAIKLETRTPLFFGRTVYKFRGYVENDA